MPAKEAPNPKEITPRAQPPAEGVEALSQVAPALGEMVGRLIEQFKDQDIGSARVTITGPEAVVGSIEWKSGEGDGVITIEGELGREISQGTAYEANWDGTFFRRPDPKLDPFVEDGAQVKEGEAIGVGFVDKNARWPIRAPLDGTVHFADPALNGTPVAPGTIIYYLKSNQK